MNKFIKGVKGFHEAFGVKEGVEYTDTEEFWDTVLLRMELMKEELDEFYKAATELHALEDITKVTNKQRKKQLLIDMLDGITDLLYVVVGTALVFNMPVEKAFRRVQESNMSKLDEDGKPIYREDGKVMKGSKYFPPKLNTLVKWDKEKGRFSFVADVR